MRYIAGIDIGNSSTEVALARQDETGALTITHSALAETTGIKGTLRNVFGIQEALALVAKRAGINVSDISLIRINEATPVIGDVAMETITETIITESTMIGHNPKTPGGVGLGVGITITPEELLTRPADSSYILVVSSAFDFADIANVINASMRAGYQITGVILQRDDGVLVSNRLEKSLPIVDEVLYIDRIPLGMLAAIEVAVPGKVIETLSNPYGIATVFNLNADETKNIVPMARALIGNRSAVVVKTPSGDVKARAIPAGNLELQAQGRTVRVDVAAGAEAIMKAVDGCGKLDNVTGEAGTNIGGMLEHVRQTMAELTNKPSSELAPKKAWTAVAMKTATHELSDVVQPGAALYGLESHLQGKVVTFGGGYALWRDGILIGGLGISGGSVEQDMDIAQTAIAAINVGTHQ
ncbi:diol dehydratase reactivase subunit alpha [Salmonella enterica]|nr:diol dehydratase reactivase subunit alpha [Salmonella enterica]